MASYVKSGRGMGGSRDVYKSLIAPGLDINYTRPEFNKAVFVLSQVEK